jgi:Holliday junction DNA helicase RuvB
VVEVNGASLDGITIARTVFEIRRKKGTLLIDEIHAVAKSEQELLYPIMDGGKFSWMGEEIDANISVIGTTTEIARLNPPLRNRFSITIYLPNYTKEELKEILRKASSKMGVMYTDEGGEVLAFLSRGVPRNAIALLDMARDFSDTLDEKTARRAAFALGYDERGLTPVEKAYIMGLYALGGKASLVVMSSTLKLDPSSARSIEEFLIDIGLIGISSGGRVLTVKGFGYVEEMTNGY